MVDDLFGLDRDDEDPITPLEYIALVVALGLCFTGWLLARLCFFMRRTVRRAAVRG